MCAIIIVLGGNFMKNIIDWQNIKEKSLFEQLKEKLEKQKNIDIINIQEECDIDELEDEINYLQQDYNLYNSKLELITEITKLENSKIEWYMQTLFKMDCLENISEKQKLKMMLSYGVLVNYFSKIHERTDEELFMLSACSSGLDLEDYTFYIGVLSDKQVSETIINKTDNLPEQVNIAYSVMDSQDEFPYDFITSDNYKILVDNGINVANNYNIGHTK
jgi:hypothetical protein